MAKFDFRIFFSQIDHERIKITEGGTENDVRAVEIDHLLHRLGAAARLRDVLFLDGFHARQRLEGLHTERMCLIPAEIIPRSDVDDAALNMRSKRGAPS